MNQQTDDLLNADTEERYDYFLSYVGVEREIWLLVNAEQEFLTNVIEDEQLTYLPIWPNADYAQRYAAGSIELTPKSIPLPQFFTKWVSGLEHDGLLVGVFPGLDGELWMTEPKELKKDLQDEISLG